MDHMDGEVTTFFETSWKDGEKTTKRRGEVMMDNHGVHDIPYHPWEWYIYLHEWLIFMVNVGKYTSPMDGMGIDLI